MSTVAVDGVTVIVFYRKICNTVVINSGYVLVNVFTVCFAFLIFSFTNALNALFFLPSKLFFNVSLSHYFRLAYAITLD